MLLLYISLYIFNVIIFENNEVLGLKKIENLKVKGSLVTRHFPMF
jgi:hypothetical protein